jgi:protein subunit release factor A
VDTFRSGGPGGQHQNKTESGVRITHKESGLSAESRDTKSQHKNKQIAFRKLAKQLVSRFVSTEKFTTSDEVVRTYNIANNRVKDHASGLEQTWKRMDFGEMIEARRNTIIAP